MLITEMEASASPLPLIESFEEEKKSLNSSSDRENPQILEIYQKQISLLEEGNWKEIPKLKLHKKRNILEIKESLLTSSLEKEFLTLVKEMYIFQEILEEVEETKNKLLHKEGLLSQKILSSQKEEEISQIKEQLAKNRRKTCEFEQRLENTTQYIVKDQLENISAMLLEFVDHLFFSKFSQAEIISPIKIRKKLTKDLKGAVKNQKRNSCLVHIGIQIILEKLLNKITKKHLAFPSELEEFYKRIKQTFAEMQGHYFENREWSKRLLPLFGIQSVIKRMLLELNIEEKIDSFQLSLYGRGRFFDEEGKNLSDPLIAENKQLEGREFSRLAFMEISCNDFVFLLRLQNPKIKSIVMKKNTQNASLTLTSRKGEIKEEPLPKWLTLNIFSFFHFDLPFKKRRGGNEENLQILTPIEGKENIKTILSNISQDICSIQMDS